MPNEVSYDDDYSQEKNFHSQATLFLQRLSSPSQLVLQAARASQCGKGCGKVVFV